MGETQQTPSVSEHDHKCCLTLQVRVGEASHHSNYARYICLKCQHPHPNSVD